MFSNEPDITTKDLVALKQIKGIGDTALKNICKSDLSIGELRILDAKALKKYIRSESAIIEFRERFEIYIEKANDLFLKLQENNVKVISLADELFPKRLLNNNSQFALLYCIGNLKLLNHEKNIAIIGSRDCSSIGSGISFKTANYFSNEGFNIISGLAKGIDSSAHKGALEENGFTTAILVDVLNITPKENKNLAEEIIRNDGLLISPNEPGISIIKGLYVARNKLQSALADAVFPIESKVDSGTMHTIRFAMDQKRLIFCPNLSKINGYDNSQERASGVNLLIANEEAVPYTRSNYGEVEEMIEKRIKRLKL